MQTSEAYAEHDSLELSSSVEALHLPEVNEENHDGLK
jgi:hypothetical protein